MSEPQDFESIESPLPGLEPPTPSASPLRIAAHRTIVALEAAGYLDETHALITQLILDLADSIDAGRRAGKASAVAMAAAQLLAAYDVITPSSEGGDTDDWEEFVADARRSATEARDAADARSDE